MEYQLKSSSIEESNLFLRKLWSEFRKYPSFRCSQMPIRLGEQKLVSLGLMEFPNSNSCSTSVKYKKRGTIESIAFHNVNEQDKSIIDKAINESKNNFKRSQLNFELKYFFQSNDFPIKNYSFKNYSILRVENKVNCLTFKAKGFDRIDALTFNKNKFSLFLNLLASQTLSPYTHIKELDFKVDKNEIENIFLQSDHVFKTPPIGLGRDEVLLDKEFCNYFSGVFRHQGELDLNTKQIYKSAKLFHDALKIVGIDYKNNDKFYEVSQTLLMSAIEVLSIDKDKQFGNCEECGQTKYKISERVKDYISIIYKYEKAQKSLSEEYSRRSKFLHEGNHLISNRFMGYYIPQLNLDKTFGVELQRLEFDNLWNLEFFIHNAFKFEIKKKNTHNNVHDGHVG